MSILTYGELDQVVRKHALDESQILNKAMQFTKDKQVFLSHSSKDRDILPKVITFLEEFGVSVYVDILDERMPDPPSPETGKLLKERIGSCLKIVVLLTDRSRQSKWVPWEIGFGDAVKGMLNLAILPVDVNPSVPLWIRQEYLGLYPVIVKDTTVTNHAPAWYVETPQNRQMLWNMRYWLHNEL